MHRRWLLRKTNPEFIEYLSKSLSISPVTAQILVNRGIRTAAAASDFLRPGVAAMEDPFSLTGMRAAVDRIKSALRLNHSVLVHGDYDADGLTATAILLEVLRAVGIEAHYFIPTRDRHGYGFNPVAVDYAAELGVRLIVTVDCGIASFEAAAHAKSKGIDVIITDHHEPVRSQPSVDGKGPAVGGEAILPEALAVVNPKLDAADGRLSALSGAGVAFKLSQALSAESDIPFSAAEALDLLDLAALGTLADVVPLTGENRIILREGLNLIREGKRAGIKALKTVCGLDAREMKAGRLAFTLVPRINAAGRIADSRDVVRLFLTREEEEASQLSSWLNELNAERQKIEEEVYQDALSKIDELDGTPVIVLSGEGWHQGVLGIVASRMAEQFYRPAFVFSVEDGIAKGSARSIPSFDVCAGLVSCADILLSFGGHKQAAGVRLRPENLPAFTRRMAALVSESGAGSVAAACLEIDIGVSLSAVTHSLLKELSMLEPFGCGNEEPLFGARALAVMSPRIVGRDHLKTRLKENGWAIDAIGFDLGAAYEELGSPSFIDAVFTPAINEWNGARNLQLVLRALRPSA